MSGARDQLTVTEALTLVRRAIEELPAIGLGDAGTLMEVWNDPEAIAFLRLMAGLPDPDDDPGPESRFVWVRDPGEPETVQLGFRLWGLRIRGPTPERIADGLEYLGRTVSAVLPEVEAAREQAGTDIPMAQALARVLSVRLTGPLPDAPFGLHFRAEADPDAVEPPPPATSPDWADLMERLHDPEVQDHRSYIPPP